MNFYFLFSFFVLLNVQYSLGQFCEQKKLTGETVPTNFCQTEGSTSQNESYSQQEIRQGSKEWLEQAAEHRNGLNQRFINALSELKILLKKQSNMNLLIVFDIDETLLHSQRSISNNEIERYNLHYQIEAIQREWLVKFDKLIRKHDNLIIAYNTARPQMNPIIKVNVDIHGRLLDKRHTTQPYAHKMLAVKKSTIGDHIATYGLPMPRALITGSGKNIQLVLPQELQNHPELASIKTTLNTINLYLQNKAEEDVLPVYLDLNAFTSLFPTSFLSSNSDYTSIRLGGLQRFRDHPFGFSVLDNVPDTYTNFITTKISHIPTITPSFMVFTHMIVNKGTSLRILIHTLYHLGIFKDRFTSVVVVGNDYPDIAMLLLYEEAKALGNPHTPLEYERLKSDIRALGIPDGLPINVSWELSILCHASHLREHYNKHIKAMLDHPKVLKILDTLGLLSILEALVEQMKARGL